MKRVLPIALFAALAMLTSCTEDLPFRTSDNGRNGPIRPQPSPLPTIDQASGYYEKAAIEDYAVADNRPGKAPLQTHFSLGVIEFSDDGVLWSSAQADAIIRLVDQYAHDEAGVTLVVFAHGWEHRAFVCDRDIVRFRKLLAGLALAELRYQRKSAKPRPVVGIYLGWRGQSIKAAKLDVLSFYNCKSAAHVIGGKPTIWYRLKHGLGKPRRDAQKVLEQLDSIYQDVNGNGYHMTMVTVGHSFGGALVYTAVYDKLTREIGGSAQDKPQNEVKGVGDLVVLVNPAFEAARYRDLANALKRKGTYPASQTPILMTVQSTGDKYNLYAFTLGRLLSAWMYPPNDFHYLLSSRVAIGYYDPVRTHTLTRSDKNATPPVSHDDADDDCAPNWALNEELRISDSVHAKSLDEARNLQLAGDLDYGDVKLTHIDGRNVDPNSPYLVVETDKNVIPAHSEIFTPPFINFLVHYVTDIRIKRTALKNGGGAAP